MARTTKSTSMPKVSVPSSIGKSLTTSKPTAPNAKTANASTRMSACK
jgi:hypothetical protein